MTDVVMPQMGESIAEGTIVRWIKKVGDSIDRDEPLFEISTDKVDAEIPSPAAGVLTEIKVKEGETVPVNSVVATIGAAGEAAVAADVPPSDTLPEAAVGQPEAGVQAGAGGEAPADAVSADAAGADAGAPEAGEVDLKASFEAGLKAIDAEGAAPAGDASSDPGPDAGSEDLRRQKSSPLVRRIALDNNVDIAQIHGTGLSGRVTKQDILGYIASGAAAAPVAAAAPGSVPQPAVPGPIFKPGEKVQIVPMSVMRKKIAEHMVLSAHTSPHVYSVYEVNFARVSALRDAHKAAYEAVGVKLTFTAFIAKVVVDTLRQFPIVNASVDGDKIVYKKDINLGIAVALDNGLIVPVIRSADEKNLLGLSRAINDVASRARAKKLNPDEVQGGTFTITNPGVFGALYGLPLINQPQVAILGVGAIEKRAVVIEDAIGIRPVCHITLGYDHRLVDGADAGRFLSFLKERLEDFDEAWL
jgi:2-oxoglutarate dehydrogenase E2 component (dihydrolipoamide succinyltransferase)